MGCVSSSLLNQEDELSKLGSSALSQHIVSLTSTTYGLLNLDPPSPQPSATTPPTPPLRFTLGSIFPSPLTEPRPDPEVINSWELMSGLDSENSFRFCPKVKGQSRTKENENPNCLSLMSRSVTCCNDDRLGKSVLDKYDKLCPPEGENRVVIYTTSLRGIRKTFEACNAVKSVMENSGVVISERDVSMDRGFKEELRDLMKNKESTEALLPPRVFVKGRYIGGADEVLRIVEEGWLCELIEGIPKRKLKGACHGCADVRFLPCSRCSGSCKIMQIHQDQDEDNDEKQQGQWRRRTTSVLARCPDCNENGLVLCPICSAHDS